MFEILQMVPTTEIEPWIEADLSAVTWPVVALYAIKKAAQVAETYIKYQL